MPRLDVPSEDSMTPEQKAALAEVISGPRGRMPSPMIAWLQNPALASSAQKLGEVLRFNTTLEPSLVELAILICARHGTSHQAWTSHKRHALTAGLSRDIIAAIASRSSPTVCSDRERLVFDVSTTLLAHHRIPNALYLRGVDTFGERGMVELVAVLGYYSLVGLTLNAFELGLPGSVAPELEDPDFAQG